MKHELPPAPPPPPTPPSPPQAPNTPDGRGLTVSGLIAIIVAVIVIGFVGHALVDLFQWAWDLWGDLVE